MLRNSKYNRISALLFALLLIGMQLYALNISTVHMLHDMPPMCELCDLAKNSVGGLVSPGLPVLLFGTDAKIAENVDFHIYTSHHSLYHSRAPPILI